MNTLEQCLDKALADAQKTHPKDVNAWRGAVLRATAGWALRKWIRAARRGYDNFGMGIPLFDCHRPRGRAWDY